MSAQLSLPTTAQTVSSLYSDLTHFSQSLALRTASLHAQGRVPQHAQALPRHNHLCGQDCTHVHNRQTRAPHIDRGSIPSSSRLGRDLSATHEGVLPPLQVTRACFASRCLSTACQRARSYMLVVVCMRSARLLVGSPNALPRL